MPSAIANFPKELYRAPKAWATGKYNLKHWSTFQKGEHPRLQTSPPTPMLCAIGVGV